MMWLIVDVWREVDVEPRGRFWLARLNRWQRRRLARAASVPGRRRALPVPLGTAGDIGP